MARLKNHRFLHCLNILFLLIGCMEIALMAMHHSLMSDFYDDLLQTGNVFAHYFFFNRYFVAVYILIFVIILGKEFVYKKPIKSKVIINGVMIAALFLALGVQMLGVNYYAVWLGEHH